MLISAPLLYRSLYYRSLYFSLYRFTLSFHHIYFPPFSLCPLGHMFMLLSFFFCPLGPYSTSLAKTLINNQKSKKYIRLSLDYRLLSLAIWRFGLMDLVPLDLFYYYSVIVLFVWHCSLVCLCVQVFP